MYRLLEGELQKVRTPAFYGEQPKQNEQQQVMRLFSQTRI